MPTVEAVVVEELPGLLYRLELENKARVLAHSIGGPGYGGKGRADEGQALSKRVA